MQGPGKYDEQLGEALEAIGAKQGILIVLDGNDGPSMCSQLNKANLGALPSILRAVADEMERDSRHLCSQ